MWVVSGFVDKIPKSVDKIFKTAFFNLNRNVEYFSRFQA